MYLYFLESRVLKLIVNWSNLKNDRMIRLDSPPEKNNISREYRLALSSNILSVKKGNEVKFPKLN